MTGGHQGQRGAKTVSSHLCNARINYNYFQHWFISVSFMISSKKIFQNSGKMLWETGYSPLIWEITANDIDMINKTINSIITNLISCSCTCAFVKLISSGMGQAGCQIDTGQKELFFSLPKYQLWNVFLYFPALNPPAVSVFLYHDLLCYSICWMGFGGLFVIFIQMPVLILLGHMFLQFCSFVVIASVIWSVQYSRSKNS